MDNEKFFHELKNNLSSSETFVCFNYELPIVVTSDKSRYWVLFIEFPNNEFKPIAYASRTLTDMETRYSTVNKKALGIVFAVTKFHHFLHGRHFTLLSQATMLYAILIRVITCLQSY